MTKPIRASKRTPCPVCDGKKWPCYQTANREVAYCESVTSAATDKDGLYRHFMVERDRSEWKPREVRREPSPEPRPNVASPDHLHLVYSALLNRLLLSHERLSRLLARGFDTRAVERGMYRDTPTKEECDEIVRLLEPLGLDGVPGFYNRGMRWRLVRCFLGTIVPYCDAQGRIRGLSYRLDTPIEKASDSFAAKPLTLLCLQDSYFESRNTSQAQRPTFAPFASSTFARYRNRLPNASVFFDSL